jgi:hypothetical protein
MLRFCKRASASIVALLLGNMEGHFWGTWRDTLNLELLREKYLEKFCEGFETCKNTLKIGISLHRRPCWGNWREFVCQDF